MNAFRPGVEAVGRVRLVEPDEAAKLFPPVYDAVRRRHARDVRAQRDLVGDPHARRPARVPRRRRARSTSSCTRSTASRRRTRSTASRGDSGDFGPETTVRAIEVMAATPEATVSLWRFLLDIDWTKAATTVPPAGRPPALPPARPTEPRAPDGLGDGLWMRLVDVGAALVGADVRRRRLGRPRRPRRVLPVERGPLAGRGRRGLPHRGRSRPRARRRRPRLGLPRRLHLPGAQPRRPRRGARSRERSTARTRCSARTSRPGAPRSSELPGRSGSRAPAGCRPAPTSRRAGPRVASAAPRGSSRPSSRGRCARPTSRGRPPSRRTAARPRPPGSADWCRRTRA